MLTRSIPKLLFVLITMLAALPAAAAPAVKLLRVDPRAAQENGNPVLTTVVDISQSKRISDATQACSALNGNAWSHR